MTSSPLNAGREMDALIAMRVMGAPEVCTLVGAGTLDDPCRLDHPDAAWRVRSPLDTYWYRWSPDGSERVVNDFLPNYSTDIAAAMDVWGKVGSRIESLYPAYDYEPERLMHWVAVTSDTDGRPESRRGHVAPTPAEAICLAALSATEAGR